MKYLLLALLVFNSPSSFASVCDEGSTNALKYRAQKDLIESYALAGRYEVPVLVGKEGDAIVYQSTSMSSEAKLNIEGRFSKFFKYSCQSSNAGVRRGLADDRRRQSGRSKFKLSLDPLPTALSSFFESRNISLLNSTKIEVLANDQSILKLVEATDQVHYNALNPAADDKNHISLLGKNLTNQLKEQFLSLGSKDEALVLNLDLQYDLVCDFLTSNASLKIVVDTEADSNALEISSIPGELVLESDVVTLVDELKEKVHLSEAQKLSNKAYFDSGVAWTNLKERREVETIESSVKSYSIIDSVLKTGLNLVGLKESTCIAENNSIFYEGKANHRFELSVSNDDVWSVEEQDQ